MPLHLKFCAEDRNSKLQGDLNRHSSVPDVQAKVLGELYNWAFNYHIDGTQFHFVARLCDG